MGHCRRRLPARWARCVTFFVNITLNFLFIFIFIITIIRGELRCAVDAHSAAAFDGRSLGADLCRIVATLLRGALSAPDFAAAAASCRFFCINIIIIITIDLIRTIVIVINSSADFGFVNRPRSGRVSSRYCTLYKWRQCQCFHRRIVILIIIFVIHIFICLVVRHASTAIARRAHRRSSARTRPAFAACVGAIERSLCDTQRTDGGGWAVQGRGGLMM
jgi:hypothetical protein